MVMWNPPPTRQFRDAVMARKYIQREFNLRLMSMAVCRFAIAFGKPEPEPMEIDPANGCFIIPEHIARELRRMFGWNA